MRFKVAENYITERKEEVNQMKNNLQESLRLLDVSFILSLTVWINKYKR